MVLRTYSLWVMLTLRYYTPPYGRWQQQVEFQTKTKPPIPKCLQMLNAVISWRDFMRPRFTAVPVIGDHRPRLGRINRCRFLLMCYVTCTPNFLSTIVGWRAGLRIAALKSIVMPAFSRSQAFVVLVLGLLANYTEGFNFGFGTKPLSLSMPSVDKGTTH